MNKLAALAFVIALASTCAAQDKVSVPLSNPGQPVTLKVTLINGSITVTAGSSSQVTVSADIQSRRRPDNDAPPGMHRIEAGRGGPQIEEDHNVVTISAGPWGSNNLVIETPANTSVQLKTVSGGHIDVTGLNGDLDIQETNGSINLKNVSGTVVAHSLNGSIVASIDHPSPDKPMSFTSLNGKIDVTLPASTKARLRLKTDNGSIYTDFDVKMEAPKTVIDNSQADDGMHRIRMDRAVFGTINGGGPEYLFQTMNGSILIHKK